MLGVRDQLFPHTDLFILGIEKQLGSLKIIRIFLKIQHTPLFVFYVQTYGIHINQLITVEADPHARPKCVHGLFFSSESDGKLDLD